MLSRFELKNKYTLLCVLLLASTVIALLTWSALPQLKEEFGVTRLCDAAASGANHQLRLLLAVGVPVFFSQETLKVHPEYESYSNPVWCAAEAGNAEGLEILLTHGGRAWIDTMECCSGGTPLGAAIAGNHVAAERILREAGATRVAPPF